LKDGIGRVYNLFYLLEKEVFIIVIIIIISNLQLTLQFRSLIHNLWSKQNIRSPKMRYSTASIILAFCALVAVQAAPAPVPAPAVRGFGAGDPLEARDSGYDFEERRSGAGE
jgi:hypothetical protein